MVFAAAAMRSLPFSLLTKLKQNKKQKKKLEINVISSVKHVADGDSFKPDRMYILHLHSCMRFYSDNS